jgi:hypothetical protein
MLPKTEAWHPDTQAGLRFDMTSMTFCALIYQFWQVKFSLTNGAVLTGKKSIAVPAGPCRAAAQNRPAWHVVCMAYTALLVRLARAC